MNEWMSIECAPKDGTWILMFDPEDEYPHVGAYVEQEFDGQMVKHWGAIYLNGQGWMKRANPTHWMPLPDPPKYKP